MMPTDTHIWHNMTPEPPPLNMRVKENVRRGMVANRAHLLTVKKRRAANKRARKQRKNCG